MSGSAGVEPSFADVILTRVTCTWLTYGLHRIRVLARVLLVSALSPSVTYSERRPP